MITGEVQTKPRRYCRANIWCWHTRITESKYAMQTVAKRSFTKEIIEIKAAFALIFQFECECGFIFYLGDS